VVSILVVPSGLNVVHTFLVTVQASPPDVHLLLVVVLHTGSAAGHNPVTRPRIAIAMIQFSLMFMPDSVLQTALPRQAKTGRTTAGQLLDGLGSAGICRCRRQLSEDLGDGRLHLLQHLRKSLR
jgi:hypothetical protein